MGRALLFLCLASPAQAVPLPQTTDIHWYRLPTVSQGPQMVAANATKTRANLNTYEKVANFLSALTKQPSTLAKPTDALFKIDQNTVRFTLPFWQVLSIQNSDFGLPELWVSDPNGLYRRHFWRASNQAETFIFADLDSRDRQILLRFPAGIPENIHTHLSLGRTEAALYEDSVHPLSGQTEWLEGEKYWLLKAGEQQTVTISEAGDTVITSLSADKMNRHTSASYQLTTVWQGQNRSTRIFSGGNAITLDPFSCPQLRPKLNRLQIPTPQAGSTLTLAADQDLLIRISTLNQGRYLFDINQPQQAKVAIKKPSRARHTHNLLNPDLPDWSPREKSLFQQSIELISNSYRDGAMAAVEVIDNQLETSPSDNAQALRNTLWSRHTSYRDLWPDKPDQSLRLGFSQNNLPARGLTKKSAEFHLLSRTRHFSLPQGRHRKHIRLTLAPLETLDNIQTGGRFAQLQAQTGGGKTLEFLFDLANETLSPLPPGKAVMEDGLFQIAADSAEFTLPGNSQKLSIRQLSGPPLAIAVEVRYSLPFRLSERELMHLLSEQGDKAHQLLLSAIDSPAATYPAPGDEPQIRLLKAHLRPLILKLDRHRAQIVEGLTNYQAKFRQIDGQNSLPTLEALSRKQNWNQLVNTSHSLSSSQDNQIRQAAMAARHLALSKLGEHASAEHFLKLSLFDPERVIRTWAAQTLTQYYLHKGLRSRVNGLYAQLIRSGDKQYFASLILNLYQGGFERDALTLALLLPDFNPEHTAQLTLDRQWYSAFKHTINRLSPVRRQHWQAVQAMQWEKFDLASDHWRQAAMPELAARAELGPGQLALLRSSSNPESVAVWHNWLKSFDIADMGYSRRSVPASLIQGYPGDVIDHAAQTRTPYYQLDPGLPLTLKIQGPGRLHVSARGILNDPGDTTYSGWLDIRNHQETLYLPLIKLSADNASIESGQTVSLPTSSTIHLGRGLHHLRFNASQSQMVRFQMEQPTLLSGSLPETQTTALWGGVQPVQANPLRYHWLQRFQQASPCHPQLQGQGFALQDILDPKQRFYLARATKDTIAPQGFAQAQKNERPQSLLPSKTMHQLAANPETLSAETAYPMALSALWYRDNDIISPAAAAVFVASARRFGGENPRIPALYSDIAKRYRWQLIDTPRSHAGIRKVDQPAVTPGSVLSRKLFLKGAPHNLTRLIETGEKLVLHYDSLDGSELKLSLAQLVLPGESLQEVKVNLSVNDEVSKSIRLPGNGRRRAFTLELNPGPHQISFSLDNNMQSAQVALTVAERGEQGFTPLDSTQQRAYFVADSSSPVKIHSPAPAMYRIDQLKGENVTTSYQAVLTQGKSLTFRAGSAPAAYFRVYQFIEKPDSDLPADAALYPHLVDSENLLDSPNLALNWLGDVDGYILSAESEHTPVSEPSAGTWGLSLRTGENRQSDEDRGSGITPLYTQTSLSYRRYFEHLNLYSRSELIHRDYTGELDSLTGIRQWFDWHPIESPWHLETYGHYYRQDVRETQGKTTNDVLYLRLKAEHNFTFNQLWRNRFEIQAHQHWMSLQSGDLIAGGTADPDVYSAYKDDHPGAWNINDRLTLNLWRDNRIYLEGELRSNSLGDLTDLDAYGLRVGVDQLYGDFTLGGDFHHRWYKNDNDRSADSEARRLNLYLDWNRWRHSHGLQLGSKLSFDFDTGINAWNLHLNWYFNSGNLKHFRPGELRFRSLQSRQLEKNTQLSPVWYK